MYFDWYNYFVLFRCISMYFGFISKYFNLCQFMFIIIIIIIMSFGGTPRAPLPYLPVRLLDVRGEHPGDNV